jgi:hypothetical protein
MSDVRKSTADALRQLADETESVPKADPLGRHGDEHDRPVALVTLTSAAQRAKAWLA